MRIALLLTVAAVVVVLAKHHDQKIAEVTTCLATGCKTNCTTENITAGDCQTVLGGTGSIKYACPSADRNCTQVTYYRDPYCIVAAIQNSVVCGVCQGGHTFGQFITSTFNCSDNTVTIKSNCTTGFSCVNCTAEQVVPVGQCTSVNGGMSVKVDSPTKCHTVNSKQWFHSSSCKGSPDTVEENPQGICNEMEQLDQSAEVRCVD